MSFNPPPWIPQMDGEANVFIGEQLPSKYIGGVDDLGLSRWPSDWRTYRGNGADAAEAFRRVAQNIDEIRAGLPTTSWSGPYDVPWPMHLDVDGPRFLVALREVYQTDPGGPRQVDPTGYCRWSSDYRIHRANGSGHDAAVRRVTNDIRKIWGLPPLDTGPNKNVIRGILRQQEWRTFDDEGDKIVLMAHAMSLFALFVRNPAAAKRQAVALAQRYGGVRVCNVLGYWDRNRPGNPDRWVAWKSKEVTPFAFRSYGERNITATPDYYTRYREFLTMLFESGLKIMDDRGDQNALARDQKIQHMTELGRLYGSLPFGREVLAGLWGVNEGWQNGASLAEGGVELVRAMIEAFRSGAGWLPDVVGLSAPGGIAPDGHEYGPELPDDIKAWSVSPATAMTIHGNRLINEHLIPHYFGYGYDRTIRNARKKVWNTEPLGGGRGVSVGELNDVELLCGMAAQALATGQEFTFMSGNGVFGGPSAPYDGEAPGVLDAPIEDMPGYQEVSHIPELLPADIHAFENVFHSGNLFADRRIVAANDPTRFDTSLHADGRFVAIVSTFNGQPRPLELQKNCSEFTVCDIVTHDVDREGPISRGQQFKHNGRVRLVVGRVA
jgi:hypothetical protein